LFSLWPKKARGKRLWDVQLENQWNSISPGTPEVNCGGPPSLELYRALETSANDNKYTTLAFTFWRCLHMLLISAYTFYMKVVERPYSIQFINFNQRTCPHCRCSSLISKLYARQSKKFKHSNIRLYSFEH
jgi:hypothetical protein